MDSSHHMKQAAPSFPPYSAVIPSLTPGTIGLDIAISCSCCSASASHPSSDPSDTAVDPGVPRAPLVLVAALLDGLLSYKGFWCTAALLCTGLLGALLNGVRNICSALASPASFGE
jgi:hypothetical protein